MRSTWGAAYAPPTGAAVPPSRRLPVAAAILSALAPGFGQAIAAKFARGAAIVLASDVVGATLAALLLAHVPGRWLPLATFVAMALAVRAWAARDAWRVAQLPGPSVSTWRRLGLVLALFVGAGAIQEFVTAPLRKRHIAEAFKLPSSAMSPALQPGDYLIASRLRRPPERGQIVVFTWPKDSAKSFVMRVVGVPGDTLAMRAGALVVNGRAASEPYAHHTDPDVDPSIPEFEWQRSYLVSTAEAARTHPSRDNWGPLVVPDDSYFVLGDNRDNSLDSRYWGIVPAELVTKRPRRIYFSRDPATGRIRWNRIGQVVGE